jgi:hypothetical protein
VTGVTAAVARAGDDRGMEPLRLPPAWQDAFRRDAEQTPAFPDPLPERRLARMLAAYIASGLVFLTLPGTLLGVRNLLGISAARRAAVSAASIQAHGHAQLFGWAGTFIIGISLYTLPKFRGSMCRSIPLAWAMWGMWTAGVALRWYAGIAQRALPAAFRVSAGLELAVAALLVWQCSRAGERHAKGQAWELPVFAGFAGLLATLAWQLFFAAGPLAAPALPPAPDRALISLALWVFCFPVAIGYSAKFFPGLMGTAPAKRGATRAAMAALVPGAIGYAAGWTPLSAGATLGAVSLACWSLRIFHRAAGRPKLSGVDARYPEFVRLSYAWLLIAAILGFGAERPGMLGASRHAFTVGFLATLIFAIGPRILPSFLNSRVLWSPRLMRWSLALLTAGCALRVISEPLAYGGAWPALWNVLAASGLVELAAVLLFAWNLAMTLATPVPSWFGRKHVNDRMSVYWLVSSYPATRKILIDNGLATLRRARAVPKSLTLREAAAADGAPVDVLVGKLGEFFEARLARTAARSS